MGAWIGFAVQIITALPALIQGVEAAFGSKKGQGASKWIAIETALATPIQSLAAVVAAEVPNADAQKISAEVAKFTKAVNDAIVAFYNSVGWPGVPPSPAA